MSIQLVLFVIAIVAFIAAVVCAGLAVYVYRTQDIPGVKADLAGELRQIAPSKGAGRRGGKKRGSKAEAPVDEAQVKPTASPDDNLTAFGAMADDTDTVAKMADDSLTVSRPAAIPDDSLTKVGAAPAAEGEPASAQDTQQIGFKVTHRQVDVHSEEDITADGKRQGQDV